MLADKGWNRLIKPRSWLKTINSEIDGLVSRGDSINVWGIPTMGTSSQLCKLPVESTSNTHFILIDTHWLSSVTPDSFYTLLNSQLSEFLTEQDGKVPPAEENTPPLMRTQQLIRIISKKHQLCIMIDTIEELSGMDTAFFSSLKALRDRFLGSITFLFVSSRPLYDHPNFQNRETFIDFACHREVISTSFSDEYIRELLPELFEYFKITATKEEEKKILEMSGGILGILKNILRVIEKDPDTKIDEESVIKAQSVLSRVRRICESLTAEEVEYLTQFAKRKPPKTKITPYLSKSGLLREGALRSSLLKYAVLEGISNHKPSTRTAASLEDSPTTTATSVSSKGIDIDIVSGEIHKDGTRLSEILSKTETRIVRMMIENQGKVVTRDEVAKQIWLDDYKDKYSDWAIDKSISRIRIKLNDTKRPHKHLVTIKGKGFKFYQSP